MAGLLLMVEKTETAAGERMEEIKDRKRDGRGHAACEMYARCVIVLGRDEGTT